MERMTILENQEKLNRLNELDVVDYDAGEYFGVNVDFNEKTKTVLMELGFTEDLINKSVDKSLNLEDPTIDLAPFADKIGFDSWEFCGGFAAYMILHTQQALRHIQSGNRVTSLQSGESYALEDMEGHDLSFSWTELTGLWRLESVTKNNPGTRGNRRGVTQP